MSIKTCSFKKTPNAALVNEDDNERIDNVVIIDDDDANYGVNNLKNNSESEGRIGNKQFSGGSSIKDSVVTEEMKKNEKSDVITSKKCNKQKRVSSTDDTIIDKADDNVSAISEYAEIIEIINSENNKTIEVDNKKTENFENSQIDPRKNNNTNNPTFDALDVNVKKKR